MSDPVEPYEALTDDKSEALAFARRMALARAHMASLQKLHAETRQLAEVGYEDAVRVNHERACEHLHAVQRLAKPVSSLALDMTVDRAKRLCEEVRRMIAVAQGKRAAQLQAAQTQALPIEVRPNPAAYFEPPVKAKHGKHSAAQALGKRAAPRASVTSASSVTSGEQAEPRQAQAQGETAALSIEALQAELDRCEKMIGVLSNVLLIAKAVPSRVKNVEQAQRELAELRQRRAELQAQLDALAAPRVSVTSGEQAEPSQAPVQSESTAPANGAHDTLSGEVIRADIVRRWNSSDVAATLRTIAADRLRGNVTVMALDAPIATYKDGALAPELVALARRCTVPRRVWRVDFPNAARTTVVYLVEYASDQREVCSTPIGTAAERLREWGARDRGNAL